MDRRWSFRRLSRCSGLRTERAAGDIVEVRLEEIGLLAPEALAAGAGDFHRRVSGREAQVRNAEQVDPLPLACGARSAEELLAGRSHEVDVLLAASRIAVVRPHVLGVHRYGGK